MRQRATTRKRTTAGRKRTTAAKKRATRPAARKRTTAAKPATRRANGKPTPRRGRKRRNPDDLQAAAALSEQFHGRPARSVKEHLELEHRRDTLTDLGRMIELTVWIDEDRPMQLTFSGVRLACSPDGGQLYFVGRQRLDLAAMGLDSWMPKDHITVGTVSDIVYHTSKAFHNFDPVEYHHEFAEEGGEEPILGYDVLSEKCYLTGGSYTVKPEGIRN